MDPFKPFSAADIGLKPGTVIAVTPFAGGSQFNVCATDKELGAGISGCVILGNSASTDTGTSALALKVFRSVLDQSTKELLRRELATVKQLGSRHPYILPFLGAAVHNNTNVILVSAYMANGNLTAYLKSRSTPRLPLVLQVAEAVRYLHDECRLVHGDLKCENVLVSDDGRALLADFGLSTVIENPGSETTTINIRKFCTIRFAAPELLTDTAVSSSGQVRSKTMESDVYAFGMLLLQAFSNHRPWMNLEHSQIISNVLRGITHPHPGFSAMERGFDNCCWETCLSCWNQNPGERPTMVRVIEKLTLTSPGEASVSAGGERPDAPPGPAQQSRDEADPILSALQHDIDRDTVIDAYTFQGQHPFRITHLEHRGAGSSANIYEGDAILPSGTTLIVSVKLSGSLFSKQEHIRDIQWRELQVTQHVRHQRLLPVFAFAHYDMWTCLISPFMKNGNMFSYLTARPFLDCRSLILQVAEAVEHLHVHESIVHGDLRCENVLISDEGGALLTDFGLSTFMTASDDTTTSAIRNTTPNYRTPEV